jgi:hypothetical protein
MLALKSLLRHPECWEIGFHFFQLLASSFLFLGSRERCSAQETKGQGNKTFIDYERGSVPSIDGFFWHPRALAKDFNAPLKCFDPKD